MSLGKILGSISPAFGMLSGKGMFGNNNMFSMLSPMLSALLGGHKEKRDQYLSAAEPRPQAQQGQGGPQDYLSMLLSNLMNRG
jgi:hypothetical protein